MTPLDAEWFRHCHAAGLVREPFLEIGSARIAGIPNLCDETKRLDLRNVTGADLAPGGALLVVTPAIWPLHRYPIDSCSPNTSDGSKNSASSQSAPPRTPRISSREPAVPRPPITGPRVSSTDSSILFGRSHWATHTVIGVAFRIMRNG